MGFTSASGVPVSGRYISRIASPLPDRYAGGPYRKNATSEPMERATASIRGSVASIFQK